jgi:hypothetical protein
LTRIGSGGLESDKRAESDKNPSGRWSTRQRPFSKPYTKAILPGECTMPWLTKLQRGQNRERVDRVAQIIEDYRSRVTGEDAATCLRDVLADLMHFARANRLDFEGELATARSYFDDERDGLV